MTLLLQPRFARQCDPTTGTTSAPRILVVDDDPDFQTSIQMRLRKYNVTLEQAFGGMQGIVRTNRSQPDLILLDLAMSQGNGEFALELIKRNGDTRDIPVIVLTGMRGQKLTKRLLRAGAEAVLHKPVPFDELVRQIGQFIDLQGGEAKWVKQ